MAEKPIPYTPPDFPESKLSPEATRTRRNLIAVFAVWALVVLLKLNPTAFTPLGIEFKNWDISISTFVSFSLVFFWLSFVIYAYKDWKTWWQVCKRIFDEKKDRVSVLQGDIDVVVPVIQDARKNNMGDNVSLKIQVPKEDNPRLRESSLVEWERFVPMWEEEKQRLKKQIRQLRIDIYARSAWDYWLPGLAVAGPIWHLLR